MKPACPFPLPRTDWTNVPMGHPPFGDWSQPRYQTLRAAKEASARWAAARAGGDWRRVTAPKELWHHPSPARMSQCLWLVVFGVVHQWNRSESDKLLASGKPPLSERSWLKRIDNMIDVVLQMAQESLLYANVPKSSIMDGKQVKELCLAAMCLCYTPYLDADEQRLTHPKVIGYNHLGDLHTKYFTSSAHPTSYKVFTFSGEDQEAAPSVRRVTTVKPKTSGQQIVKTSSKGKARAVVASSSVIRDVFTSSPPLQNVALPRSRSPTPLASSSRPTVPVSVSTLTPALTPDTRRRQQPIHTTPTPAGSLASRLSPPTPPNTLPLRSSPRNVPNSSPLTPQSRPLPLIASGPRGNQENVASRRRPPTPTSTKPNKRR